MEELKYYLDLDNDFVFAHESSTDFFAGYMPETKEWKTVNISFAVFKHDRYYKNIAEEEALAITNGISPERLYREYLDMLRRNMGLT